MEKEGNGRKKYYSEGCDKKQKRRVVEKIDKSGSNFGEICNVKNGEQKMAAGMPKISIIKKKIYQITTINKFK